MRRVLLVVSLVLTVACIPRPPRPPDPPPQLEATFAVEVRAEREGTPVVGATLQAGDQTAITNLDGYAAVVLVKNRAYAVALTAPGYIPWTADVSIPGNTQVPVALAPVPPNRPWEGQLRLSAGSQCFVDATNRCRLVLSIHFMEAFSRWLREPDRVRDEIRQAKAAGYDLIRFLDTLGFYQMAWQGREVMPWDFVVCHDPRWAECDGHTHPATPDYYRKLREFLIMVRDEGMAVHHSRGDLNGQPLARVVAHARAVAALYDEVGVEVVALAEGNNEDFQNGGFEPNGLRQIVQPFKDRGALTALSAPPNSSEEPVALRAYAADVFYVHGNRSGGIVAIIRHIFSIAREAALGLPRLGWQGEPAGPGSGVSGGQVNDPEALAWMAAMSFISRQAWTYMSGHGVFYDGPLHTQAGYWAVPRLRARLAEFAPDIMTCRLTHGGTREAALVSPTGYWGDQGVTNGPERIDQTICDDGRIVALIYGGGGVRSFQNRSGRPLDVAVLNVNDDETLGEHHFALDPMQTLNVDYRVGRLLLARPLQ